MRVVTIGLYHRGLGGTHARKNHHGGKKKRSVKGFDILASGEKGK